MKTTQNKLISRQNNGFTIVELLVVVVVIGILAAITLISYRGISARANEAALTADLSNAKKQLALYFAENNTYPTALDANKCPSAPIADTNYCLKSSNGNILTYYGNALNFTLSATKGNQSAVINNDTSPKTLSLTPPTDCPSGFIPVPGSATYGTDGFCVMKYEAKNAGSNIPVSTATGTPWVNINQTDAMTYSKNVAGCTGCNLISEAQWMTLAQNVLSVNSNWSGGTVGSGYIYSGHNDNAPANSLAADASDANGYTGTGQTTGNQKRTLTLTNGEVIWDMAGNITEWTSGQVSGANNQPGAPGTGWTGYEWPSVTSLGTISVSPTPASTGLSGAASWSTGNGVGYLASDTTQSALRGFLRGGYWNGASNAGVLFLNLNNAPSTVSTYVGFRVAAVAP